MAEAPSFNDRLDSWKEIAAYLNRTERTVIRWEKRGLPVHRVPGGKKQAIFAYKHELDGWLRLGIASNSTLMTIPVQQQTGRDLESAFAVSDLPPARSLPISANEESKSTTTEQSAESPHSGENNSELPPSKEMLDANLQYWSVGTIQGKKWRMFALIGSALAILAVIGSGIVLLYRQNPIRIAHLQKLTADGRIKGHLRSDGRALYFNEFEGNREILVSAPIGGGPIHRIDTPFANVDLQDSSHDGQNLLVTSFDGMESGGRPLWVIPATGGTPRRIGDVLCDLARWSRDNRRIACTNGHSILIFDSDGSAAHTIGSFPGFPLRLLWSANGEKLRFVLADNTARTQTPWELVIGRDESTMTAPVSRIPLGRNCCWDWIWTEDGEDFVYTKHDAISHTALFVRPEHGWFMRETKLPVEIPDIGDLAPGKGNNELYMVIGGDNRDQLLKFDSRSKSFQTFLLGLSADCLSFSRDGQWMTYITLSDQSLWRSRIDGSDAIQLTKPPMEAEFSAWAPDGRRIAFMGKKPGRPWQLFLVDRDGGEEREIALDAGNQGAPTWSGDGTRLAYGNVACEQTHSCWIRWIELATGKEHLLQGSNGFHTARWSPNGKYIAALQPQTHELMLFDVRTQRWTALADAVTGDNPNWSTDSQYIYVDTLQEQRPVIERVRISDKQRITIADLAPLQKTSGKIDYWIGLSPDNSPILLHQFSSVEVYVLEWTTQ